MHHCPFSRIGLVIVFCFVAFSLRANPDQPSLENEGLVAVKNTKVNLQNIVFAYSNLYGVNQTNHLFFAGYENTNYDYNNDGDSNDYVYFHHNIKTGETKNLNLVGSLNDIVRPQRCGPWVQFDAYEDNNIDLNNDGDTTDWVELFYNVQTEEMINLELHGTPNKPSFSFSLVDFVGPIALIGVEENGLDLNKDGDTNDFVLHRFDLETRELLNLEVVAYGDAKFPEDTIKDQASKNVHYLRVDENSQGQDLNGDGDLDDRILHAYHLKNDRLTNLKYDVWGTSWEHMNTAEGLVFLVEERRHGADLNNDGDQNDDVVHFLKHHDLSATNLGLAAHADWPYSARSGQSQIIIFVPESEQGNTDLNGDSDTKDDVAFIHDVSTAQTTNLGLAAAVSREAAHAGNKIIFVVSETSQKSDLNGDRDKRDLVIVAWDHRNQTLINTKMAGSIPTGPMITREDNRFFPVNVNEDSQGETDLNGDGDSADRIIHIVDARTMTFTNLQMAGDGNTQALRIHQGVVSFVAEEDDQNQDLNGDGDTNDDLVCLYNISKELLWISSEPLATRWASPEYFSLFSRTKTIGVTFKEEYVDYDQDGRFDGQVMHSLDYSGFADME